MEILAGSVRASRRITGSILRPEVVNGKSAYEIALEHGFEGTEQEWLDSLWQQAAEVATEENATILTGLEASATAAAATATAASESATNSEGRALIYANNAQISAEAAEASATSIGDAEQQAKAAAEEAAASAEAAARSAQEAADIVALEVVQEKGDSKVVVMSQHAVTQELEKTQKRVVNLEASVYGDIATEEVNADVAYVKDVPTAAKPYARVDMIGGMTYRVNTGTEEAPEYVLRSAPVTEVKSISGVNLIPFPYATPSGIYNGVNFTANADGSISVSGKANNSIEFLLFDFQGVLPDGDYTISGTVGDVKVYINKIINGVYSDIWGETSFKCSSNVTGGKCYLYVQGGKTVNATIYPMLNKGTTAIHYTPYVKHTLPIPAEVRAKPWHGLGISKDVCNAIRYNEDGSRSGEVKCGEVDMGTLEWTLYEDSSLGISYFYSGTTLPRKHGSGLDSLVCAPYEAVSNRTQLKEKCIAPYNESNNGNLCVKDSRYTDAASFKAAMSGVMLVYELATPTTEDISDILPADNLIGVQGGGTLTFVNEYGYDVPSEVVFITKEVTE